MMAACFQGWRFRLQKSEFRKPNCRDGENLATEPKTSEEEPAKCKER